MTILTFADLKTQIATYLNRSNLTAQIPVFVQQCETRIYYGCHEKPFDSDPLRVSAMETSADLTFSSQTAALPSDFLAQRRLYISGTPGGRVDFVTPDIFWDMYSDSSCTGQPRRYTIEAGNAVAGPIPDSTYTGKLLYYKKFAALSVDTDTNWILANAPGAYLWGSLIEAYRYARNVDQAQMALNTFAGIINGLNDADKSDVYSSPWKASVDTYTP